MKKLVASALLIAAAVALEVMPSTPTDAQDRAIIVSSTTSTEDSGLFTHILPLFREKTGITVKVVSQGTGQALDTGRRGDADVVFVHAKSQEEKFVADGFGVKRFDVMYNDFVLVGPKADPARAKGGDTVKALRAIAASKSPFISRGDKSGTHSAELALWKQAEFDVSSGKDGWYKDIGQGMGAALNAAAASGAYVLTDRGTWISFRNKGDLDIIVEGDRRLFNQYGVILVNPERHKHVKKELGQAFVDWLVSIEGQNAIGSFKIDGQQLFFPNAHADEVKKAS